MMRINTIIVAAVCLSLAGCETIVKDDRRPLAAAVIAVHSGDATPTPGPKPTPKPGDKCDNCNGTGRVGDGRVSVPCPVCGGDGVR